MIVRIGTMDDCHKQTIGQGYGNYKEQSIVWHKATTLKQSVKFNFATRANCSSRKISKFCAMVNDQKKSESFNWKAIFGQNYVCVSTFAYL